MQLARKMNLEDKARIGKWKENAILNN